MAAAITMDSSAKIVMDGGSSNGQQRHNGWRDSGAIAMGDGMAVAQLTAKWAVDDHCQCRSGAMRGNTRWTAAAIRMDSGRMITMDGGSGNRQWRRNGRQDGGAITMGNGMAAARWMAQGSHLIRY
jgi:hypothetical protein